MQRSLVTRLEELERKAPSEDRIDTILISFVSPGDDEPLRCSPIAIKEMRGDWRLDREPGEEVEAFRDRLGAACSSLAARLTFPFVLCFRVGSGLPLHVAGSVRTATGERVYMVNHIALARPLAGTGGWAGVLLLKFDLGALTALDASVNVERR